MRETWPGVGILLEKPVSTGTVGQVREVLEKMRGGETGVVAVAYMLRYSKVCPSRSSGASSLSLMIDSSIGRTEDERHHQGERSGSDDDQCEIRHG